MINNSTGLHCSISVSKLRADREQKTSGNAGKEEINVIQDMKVKQEINKRIPH